MEEILLNTAQTLVNQFPVAASILMVLGIARVVNKPLFALAKAFVAKTETTKDDEFLVEVETSKFYKALCFILDWTVSIKLPAKTQLVKMDVLPSPTADENKKVS